MSTLSPHMSANGVFRFQNRWRGGLTCPGRPLGAVQAILAARQFCSWQVFNSHGRQRLRHAARLGSLTAHKDEWEEGMPPGWTMALKSQTPFLKRQVKTCRNVHGKHGQAAHAEALYQSMQVGGIWLSPMRSRLHLASGTP